MDKFSFYNPTHIYFGAGTLEQLGSIVKKYGTHCLLVSTSNDETVLRALYDRIKGILANAGVEVIHFDEVVPNPTVQSIEKAIGIVKEQKVEVIVAVGGGSSIDTGKSISLFWQPDHVEWDKVYDTYTSPFEEYEPVSDPMLPLIAVPTTAGTGSELTQAMVISDLTTEEKVCIFHDKAFPKEAVIDVELTKSMPRRLTAMTGFDAFAHSFESFMREKANIYTKTIGLVAMKNVVYALPRLMDDPENLELRTRMSEAEMFSGISLSNAGGTIPHPLSEIIGGISPYIPHGQALACVYPEYLRFQSRKKPQQSAVIARLFDPVLEDVDDAQAAEKLPELMERFLEKIGLNKKLGELGVTKDEMNKMENHFLLGVLPFGTKEELTAIMQSAF